MAALHGRAPSLRQRTGITMNNIARIYRAEIMRAAFGPGAEPAQAADLDRLNQIAERLAECKEVHGILRAKGHGAQARLLSIACARCRRMSARWFALCFVWHPHRYELSAKPFRERATLPVLSSLHQLIHLLACIRLRAVGVA